MKSRKENVDSENDEAAGSQKLLALFLIGLFIILLGIVIITVATALSSGDSASSGIIIFIGPIPIVFGTSIGAPWLILFSIILAILTILVFLIMRRSVPEDEEKIAV